MHTHDKATIYKKDYRQSIEKITRLLESQKSYFQNLCTQPRSCKERFLSPPINDARFHYVSVIDNPTDSQPVKTQFPGTKSNLYLHVILSSLLEINPSYIDRLFVDNNDTSFTVSLYNPLTSSREDITLHKSITHNSPEAYQGNVLFELISKAYRAFNHYHDFFGSPVLKKYFSQHHLLTDSKTDQTYYKFTVQEEKQLIKEMARHLLGIPLDDIATEVLSPWSPLFMINGKAALLAAGCQSLSSSDLALWTSHVHKSVFHFLKEIAINHPFSPMGDRSFLEEQMVLSGISKEGYSTLSTYWVFHSKDTELLGLVLSLFWKHLKHISSQMVSYPMITDTDNMTKLSSFSSLEELKSHYIENLKNPIFANVLMTKRIGDVSLYSERRFTKKRQYRYTSSESEAFVSTLKRIRRQKQSRRILGDIFN